MTSEARREERSHGRYYAEYVWVTGEAPEEQLQEVLDAKEGMAPGRGGQWAAGRRRSPLLGHHEAELRQDQQIEPPRGFTILCPLPILAPG